MRRIVAIICAALVAASAFADEIVLESSTARLVFDGGNAFGIKSFVMEGVDIAAPVTTAPWEVELLGPRGENPHLKPVWATYKGGEVSGKEAVFTWSLLLEGTEDYTITMRVSLEGELPSFRLEADLPSGWIVTMAEFPRIAVRRPEGAKAILPVGYGTEYVLSGGGWLGSDYPSCTGSMQMTLMYSPEGTVFFSTRDYDASGKKLMIGGEGPASIFLQKTVTSYGWTAPDGHFSLPWEAVIGFTKDSWENTAIKWYRPFALSTEWGRRSIGERPVAEWIKQSDMWLRPIFVKDETMEAVRKGLAYYGPGTGLHWYQWHNHPFDTNYPEYFPPKDGFREMVAEAERLGGHVTPYINGRLWDPANHTYKDLGGEDASCRKPDGSLYTEVYGSRAVNTVTCPASPLWQDVLRDLNRRILEELGTDGVYMDQIGAAKGEACYSYQHGHEPGGGDWWHKAYRELLTDMRENLYPADKAMTTEENAECYIDLFDMMLVVNTPHNSYTKMVPLFPLIYSDRCIYSGFSYEPWKLNDGSLMYITGRSLVWGVQLGWVDPGKLMKEENAREAAYLKTLSSFRKSNHDIFLGGQFLGEFTPGGDNPTVDIPGYQLSPYVMAALWKNTEGKEVFVLTNMDSKKHKVTLPDGRTTTVKPFSAKRIWK